MDICKSFCTNYNRPHGKTYHPALSVRHAVQQGCGERGQSFALWHQGSVPGDQTLGTRDAPEALWREPFYEAEQAQDLHMLHHQVEEGLGAAEAYIGALPQSVAWCGSTAGFVQENGHKPSRGYASSPTEKKEGAAVKPLPPFPQDGAEGQTSSSVTSPEARMTRSMRWAGVMSAM